MCRRCVHGTAAGPSCPVCIRSRPKNTQSHSHAGSPRQEQQKVHPPIVTLLVAATCLAIFGYDWQRLQAFVFGTGPVNINGGIVEQLGELTLYAPIVQAEGEWFRVVTSGFVHFGWTHLAMNMILLVLAGRLIEGRYGALAFSTIYIAGLLGGSLGAVLLDYDSQVGGASGAIFALLGSLAVLQKMAGGQLLRTGIGPLLVVNVALSFLPDVSLGGHLGGLAAGVLAGLVIGSAQRLGPRALTAAPVVVAALGFALFVAVIPAIDWAVTQAS